MISAIITVVLGWFITFCILAGLGQLVRGNFFRRVPVDRIENWFDCFWLGYVAAIALLLVLHLALPVDWKISLIVASPGVVGFVGLLRSLRTPIPWKRLALLFVLLTPVALWFASRALYPQLDFDSGMYHFAAIQWANSYPAVPGLGNLHYRLAFNQSFFLFVAALNAYPFFDQGFHIANSLLLLVLFAQLINNVSYTLWSPSDFSPYRLLNVLLIPVVAYRATHQPYSANMSSPSPDLSVFVFELVVILAFTRALFDRQPDDEKRSFLILFMVALSAVAITTKLSFAAFGAVMILLSVVLWLIWRRQAIQTAMRQAAIWLLAVGLCVGVPWIINGIVSSGYPLFPSSVGALPVDYRIPKDITDDAANWVYTFARDPRGDANVVLNSWDWLPGWERRMDDSFSQFLFVWPLYVSLIAVGGYVILAFLAVIAGQRERLDLRMGLPIIPAGISAVFWFFSAPDPRFAGAAFWILALWSGIMVLSIFLKSPKRVVVYGALVVPVSLAAFIVAGGLQTDFSLDGTGFPAIPVQATEIYQTASGLQVNVSANPNDSLELWNAPLPASPYKLAQLELRDGSMRDGFRMGATPTAAKSDPEAGN